MQTHVSRRRRRAPPTIVTAPTLERLQHGRIVYPTEDAKGRFRPFQEDAQTPFDTYRLDNTISPRQYDAGARFRRIYFIAHGSGVKTMSWEVPITGRSAEISDSRESAILNLRTARGRLNAFAYSILESVCGHGHSHSRWARDCGLAPNAGRPILIMACDDYANYLRLPE